MARKELRTMRMRGAVVAVMAAIFAVGLTAAPATAEVTAMSGGASGVQVDVTLLGIHTTLAATPNVTLPADGNAGVPVTSSVLTVNLPGVLTTGVLNASTVGDDLNSDTGYATSNASVADVNVIAGLVSADVVASTCTANRDGVTGSTTLTDASVTGIGDLAVSPSPNTKITLAGVATITLNEQTVTDTPDGVNAITVNAIHVHLEGVLASGDIYIGRSVCSVTDVDAATEEPPATPTDPGTPTGPSDPGTPTGTPTTPTATPTAPPATPTTATPNFTG
jgi:hypothetical protein